jgi:hypothetical protein
LSSKTVITDDLTSYFKSWKGVHRLTFTDDGVVVKQLGYLGTKIDLDEVIKDAEYLAWHKKMDANHEKKQAKKKAKKS